MQTLYVYPEARELGIHYPVACLIQNVHVADSGNALDEDIEQLMSTLAERFEAVKQTGEFQGFAEMFTRMGYEGQIPAGQRLVEGFLKKGFKKINNVVDAYNIVSASNACGLGLHDADKTSQHGDQVDIFCATGVEKIIPLFKNSSVSAKSGDLLYGQIASQSRLFAWLGKKDVDSDEYKVTEETTNLLLIVTGNSATSELFNRRLCESVFGLLKKTCPKAQISYLNIFKKCS